MGIKLTECYPKTIGAIEYAQDSSDVGRIDIEFVFKEHFHIDGQDKAKNDEYRPVIIYNTPVQERHNLFLVLTRTRFRFLIMQ